VGPKPQVSAAPDPAPRERLLSALGLALVGPLALASGADAATYLAWLAIVAPSAGCLAAALGVGLVPYGLAVPGAWLLVLAAFDATSRAPLATPFFGGLVVAGLFAAGAALGRLARQRAAPRGAAARGWAGAGWLLLVAALAAGLPGRGGAAGAPLAPALASVLLDLSPATLALESAGLDWMRDPAVYDRAGTDRFQRAPYRGALAGPVTLLVGCLAAALAALLTRESRGARDPRP
jgi:hypothetical protein